MFLNISWDNACLRDELMTGFLREGATPILSRITIGSLLDLGYEVDFSEADPFDLFDLG